jgi:hypothetical protein
MIYKGTLLYPTVSCGDKIIVGLVVTEENKIKNAVLIKQEENVKSALQVFERTS